MMLVAVLANKLEELLKIRHFDYPVSAEGVQLVFGKPAFSQIRGYAASKVVRGNPAIRKRSRTDSSDDCAIGVFLADRSRDDFLVIHFLLGEKCFGQIRAVEHH